MALGGESNRDVIKNFIHPFFVLVQQIAITIGRCGIHFELAEDIWHRADKIAVIGTFMTYRRTRTHPPIFLFIELNCSSKNAKITKQFTSFEMRINELSLYRAKRITRIADLYGDNDLR
jgi:hypothetical protein